MRVCKKMVIHLGIKTPQSRKERKYTWQYCLIVSLNYRCWRFVWKDLNASETKWRNKFLFCYLFFRLEDPASDTMCDLYMQGHTI